MKAGEEHRAPSSDRALEILAEARRCFGDSHLVLRSDRTKGDDTDSERRSGVGQRKTVWTGRSRKSLAYVKGIEGTYQRSDLLERCRVVMQAWADYARDQGHQPT